MGDIGRERREVEFERVAEPPASPAPPPAPTPRPQPAQPRLAVTVPQ